MANSNGRASRQNVGAEVTYIRPVIEDGRRRRLVQYITFQHDAELGWFLGRSSKKDGRDYIDICSELKAGSVSSERWRDLALSNSAVLNLECNSKPAA